MEKELEHRHYVFDSDPHFSIDPITRVITNQSKEKTKLIQYDHNSERFTFEIPRYVEGHDMSLSNRVEIHYINISGSSTDKNEDVYICEDKQLNEENVDKVVFSWLISRNATIYAGKLNFLVKFICSEEDKITYAWNTSIFTDITIANGMNNGEPIVEEYSDILQQWYDKIVSLSVVANPTEEASEYLLKLKIDEKVYSIPKEILQGINGNDVVNIITNGYRNIDVEWELGGINAAGILVPETFGVRSIDFIGLEKNATFEVASLDSKVNVYIAEYDENKTFIQRQATSGKGTLSPTSKNCAYVKVTSFSESNAIEPFSQKEYITTRFIYDTITIGEINKTLITRAEYDNVISEILNNGYKNVDCEWENGGVNSNGIINTDVNSVRTGYIEVLKAGKLVLEDISKGSNTIYMAEYDKDFKFITRKYCYYPDTLSPTSANCAYVICAAYNNRYTQDVIPSLVVVRYEDIRPKTKASYAFDSITMKSINHRGFNRIAPENTLPAYRLSKQKGFDFVECDVGLTSDGVPVLLHDETINRTARNEDGSTIATSINIADITYEQALTYDFGIWLSNVYAGTKIPTLDEFIALCKNLGLFAYIELKATTTYTDENIANIVNIVKKYGMERSVSYISFSMDILKQVSKVDKNARLGFVQNGAIDYTIKRFIFECKTDTNSLFFDCNLPALTTEIIDICENNNITIETYCPNDEASIIALDSRVLGVTSDTLVAKNVLLNANIGEQDTGL